MPFGVGLSTSIGPQSLDLSPTQNSGWHQVRMACRSASRLFRFEAADPDFPTSIEILCNHGATLKSSTFTK